MEVDNVDNDNDPTIVGSIMRRRRRPGAHAEHAEWRRERVARGAAREARDSAVRRDGAAGEWAGDGAAESIDRPETRDRPSALARFRSALGPVVAYDYETRRLLQLAVPFTFSAVFETVSDLVILAIIAHKLGTDAMIAYTMTGKTTPRARGGEEADRVHCTFPGNGAI